MANEYRLSIAVILHRDDILHPHLRWL